MPDAYASEAALCAALAGPARAAGWVVHAEVAYWDLVLVRAGVQVGVQAKLTASWRVLYQAARRAEASPDHRCVLVPKAPREFRELAGLLGIGVYHGDYLRQLGDYAWLLEARGELVDAREPRLDVPSIEAPSVVAGASSPRSLTAWRERVLVACALLRERGWILAEELARLELRAQNLVAHGYLDRGGTARRGRTRLAVYVAGPKGLPDDGWERERAMLWARRGAEFPGPELDALVLGT